MYCILVHFVVLGYKPTIQTLPISRWTEFTRIKVLFCLFIYTGEVCYFIPQTLCILENIRNKPIRIFRSHPVYFYL
jgi:hypothetical protein